MDGIHDLGGRQGYGPIDVHEPEEPFHKPWEARVLGIVRAFTRPANWSNDWFRHVRELIEPADYLTRPYYDQWLQTYAAMMVDSGVATVKELATGRSARSIPDLAPPSSPEKVAAAKRSMARFDREPKTPPAFNAGDKVRTRSLGAVGHTRLPQYARGHVGVVEAHHGSHVLPDSNMRGDGPAEPLYTVSFLTADLWPEAAGRKDRIYLDFGKATLSGPEAALLPREPEAGAPVFAEPWHAEVLAIAHTLAKSGLFSPAEWAEALGAELRRAASEGRPDTEETYYEAALAALEALVGRKSPGTGASLAPRIEAWRRAYLNTPHGQPVTLAAADGPSHQHHDH